jgi:hypothetical protein
MNGRMKSTESKNEKQPAKRSAFTVMNNVRDYCEQSDAKKVLLFTLATYSEGKGIYYPSNETLSDCDAQEQTYGSTDTERTGRRGRVGNFGIRARARSKAHSPFETVRRAKR